VIPVRALKNVGTNEFGKLQLNLIRKLEDNTIDRMEAQYEVERFWMGALKNAVVDGDMKNGSLMAGQSVGLADKILPLQGIFDELVNDAEAEMQRLAHRFCN
jgi:enoyl-[acyl-carrier protein] reductase II